MYGSGACGNSLASGAPPGLKLATQPVTWLKPLSSADGGGLIAVKLGWSLTNSTLMVNVCGTLISTPLYASVKVAPVPVPPVTDAGLAGVPGTPVPSDALR